MKRFLAGAWCLLIVTSALAQGRMAMDRDFARKAAMSGGMEVALGQYAADHGQSRSVRSFGASMVQDHNAANRSLMAIARREGFKVSAKPSGEMQDTMRRLMHLDGRAFDRAYKAQMVSDHQAAIMMFQDESRNGHGALSQFARRTLPALRHHLQMAQALR